MLPVEAHKRFWIGLMGGTPVKNGPLELIQFPGVYVMLRKVDKAVESNNGAIVNRFGFTVKDFPASLAKWKAASIKIEPTQNPNEVYVNAPDGVRVEVYGEPALPTPVSMNHIHCNAPDIPGIKTWCVKAFGAHPGPRPSVASMFTNPTMIEAGDMPGVRPLRNFPLLWGTFDDATGIECLVSARKAGSGSSSRLRHAFRRLERELLRSHRSPRDVRPPGAIRSDVGHSHRPFGKQALVWKCLGRSSRPCRPYDHRAGARVRTTPGLPDLPAR